MALDHTGQHNVLHRPLWRGLQGRSGFDQIEMTNGGTIQPAAGETER